MFVHFMHRYISGCHGFQIHFGNSFFAVERKKSSTISCKLMKDQITNDIKFFPSDWDPSVRYCNMHIHHQFETVWRLSSKDVTFLNACKNIKAIKKKKKLSRTWLRAKLVQQKIIQTFAQLKIWPAYVFLCTQASTILSIGSLNGCGHFSNNEIAR